MDSDLHTEALRRLKEERGYSSLEEAQERLEDVRVWVRYRHHASEILVESIRAHPWRSLAIILLGALGDILIRQPVQREGHGVTTQVGREHSLVSVPSTDPLSIKRTMRRVEGIFRFVALIVPRRIYDEEVGDALEVMNECIKRSPSRWPIYVKLVSTVFWIAINTTRHLVASLKGSTAEPSKKTSGD